MAASALPSCISGAAMPLDCGPAVTAIARMTKLMPTPKAKTTFAMIPFSIVKDLIKKDLITLRGRSDLYQAGAKCGRVAPGDLTLLHERKPDTVRGDTNRWYRAPLSLMTQAAAI